MRLRGTRMGPDSMVDSGYRLPGLVQKSDPVYTSEGNRVVNGVINGVIKSQLEKLLSERFESFHYFLRDLSVIDFKWRNRIDSRIIRRAGQANPDQLDQ